MRILLMCCVLLMVGGCAAVPNQMALNGPSRTSLSQFAKIENLAPVKACVRPYVAGKRVAIQQALDNAGKTNSVSDTGTGNFMSGSQTANFVIPLLKDEMGMTVQSLTNMSGELALRQYLSAEESARRQKVMDAARADYMLDVSPLSLDFTATQDATLLVKGIGGYANSQAATLSGGAKLLDGDGSQDVLGFGGMKLTVFSMQAGGMLGRVFGNTLVTGEAGLGAQQPMQLWSGEYVAQLTTLKALTDLPNVPPRCGEMLDGFIGPDTVSI